MQRSSRGSCKRQGLAGIERETAKGYWLNRQELEDEIVGLSKELTRARLDAQNLREDLGQRQEELGHLQQTLEHHLELKERCFVVEQKLSSQVKANRLLKEKLGQLQAELGQGREEALLSPRADQEGGQERIVEGLRRVMQEQISARGEAMARQLEELRTAVHELKARLASEQLQHEALQVKFRLVDQDNQSLRQTLVAASRRLDESPRRARSRVEEINELIATAQRNYEQTDILNWQKKRAAQLPAAH